MSDNTIILKAKDFHYPSLEEIENAAQNLPNITRFGFNDILDIVEFSNGTGQEEKHFYSHLSHWDNAINSKIAKLRTTYIYTSINFKRGIPVYIEDFEYKHHINSNLFEYYSEIFYYMFFSVRDLTLQLINTYFKFNISEDVVSMRTVKNKSQKKIELKTALDIFSAEVKLASDIRNSFTHKLPPNMADNRPGFKNKNGKNVYYIGIGFGISPNEAIQNMDSSLLSLNNYFNALKEIITPRAEGTDNQWE